MKCGSIHNEGMNDQPQKTRELLSKVFKTLFGYTSGAKARQQKMDSESQTFEICDYTPKYARVRFSLEKILREISEAGMACQDHLIMRLKGIQEVTLFILSPNGKLLLQGNIKISLLKNTYFLFYLLFIWLSQSQLCGIQFSEQRLKSGPLNWEHGVLVIGQPGESLKFSFIKSTLEREILYLHRVSICFFFLIHLFFIEG